MAVVGKDTPFGILDDARVGAYLTAIEGDERAPQAQDDTLVSTRGSSIEEPRLFDRSDHG